MTFALIGIFLLVLIFFQWCQTDAENLYVRVILTLHIVYAPVKLADIFEVSA